MNEQDVSNRQAESSAPNENRAGEPIQTNASDRKNTKAEDIKCATQIISKLKLSSAGKLELSDEEKAKFTAEKMLDLARRLKNEKIFNYARRVLARAAHHPSLAAGSAQKLETDEHEPELEAYRRKLKLEIYQQWALCTYKDSDSPADLRLDKAIDILSRADNLETTKNQETLGLAGAVYKRKWEVDNQKVHLERALLYYKKGYLQGTEGDQGYNGINAAFIYDLLARQEEDEAKKTDQISPAAEQFKREAQNIREDIVKTVSPMAAQAGNHWLADKWWYFSTVAEAYFGLKNYPKAVQWLQLGIQSVENIPGWEKESTIRQLAQLAVTQTGSIPSWNKIEESGAWKALDEAFGSQSEAARTGFLGKIGLALSGGGFRASLFHIGTLAKLAELGVLRYVEAISCVSGGSIIGAHYYLEVRKLLETKADNKTTDQDYIDIVKRIETDFLDGVKRNIRMRIATNFKPNIDMLFRSGYTRSTRIGELYESEIFSRVKHHDEENAPRYFSQLKINPVDEEKGSKPSLYNWRRKAKVPNLILNATTLNTGHNWQFTASWMGEPPSNISSEVDTNDQFRRMYYDEAAGEYKKSVRLGDAVAASACVPGLFDSVSLENLYPERTVRLVDGGVCDNQGVSSLLEQDCNVILASDASGQMESQDTPSNGLVGVLLRANTILQARIRDAQYHDLERRKRSNLLRELMFVHLKEGLNNPPINWIDCQDPFSPIDDLRLENKAENQYKISPNIQKQLASVRTDLDSFSDVEAYALMTSAYRMTEAAFETSEWIKGFSKTDVSAQPWGFLKVESGMVDDGEKLEQVGELLSVSNSLAFKGWKLWRRAFQKLSWTGKIATLVPPLAVLSVLAAAVALLVWLFVYLGATGKLIGMIAVGALVLYVAASLIPLARGRKTLSQVILGIIISLMGWFLSHIHLRIFDKRFLKRGSIGETFK